MILWYLVKRMLNSKKRIIFLLLFFILFHNFAVMANIDVPDSDVIQFSGRLHFDLLYNNNKNKSLNKNSNGIKDLSNNLNSFYVSSIMFNTKFKLSPDSLIVLKLDSKPNSINVKELYLTYTFSDKVYFILGQTAVQSSLESIGYNYTIFNNYSLFSSSDLFASYTSGFILKYLDKNYGTYIGIYSNSIHDKPSGISKLTFIGRAYFNPIRNGDNVIHIGMNTYQENRNNKIDNFKDLYPFKQIQMVGVELAINYSIFNFQSEYRTSWIEPEKYQKKFGNLYNFYLEGTINLTGENMIYKEGTFNFLKVKNPIDKNGYGAFSMSFKFSETNINLKNNSHKINCGKYDEYITAFNWTPKDGIRFTLQYSKIDEDFVDKKNSYDFIQLKTRIFF